MKQKFLYSLIVTGILQLQTHGTPHYDGTGPQNVYYLTGVGDNLFHEDSVWGNQDGWSKPYKALRDAYVALGYNFYTSLQKVLDEKFKQNVYAVFVHNTPGASWASLLGSAIDKWVVLALEPGHIWPWNDNPSVTKHYKKILTWNDAKVDNKQFFKYFFVQSNLTMIDPVIPFHNKKLCTLISGNKKSTHKHELYSKRKDAIAFFEKYAPKDFDFYGHKWDRKAFKTYRGPVKSKTNTYKKYKFAICYENIAHHNGYVTEKIFGSMVAGCVPIYWGADDIADYVPEGCYIDKREFPNFKNLYTFISTMQEEKYNQYLDNIRTFLSSKEAEKFSIDNFVDSLMALASK